MQQNQYKYAMQIMQIVFIVFIFEGILRPWAFEDGQILTPDFGDHSSPQNLRTYFLAIPKLVPREGY